MIAFNIKKIKIQFHLTFFIFMFIMIALNYTEQFFILFLSVSLHELTHIITAYVFGAETEKIVITPIGEIALIKDLEYLSCGKKIIIMLAGPFINLILYAAVRLIFPVSFTDFKLYNLCLCFFNLIPAYPLDGGKILSYFLSNRIGIIPSNKVIFKTGKIFSGIVIITGFSQVILFPYNVSLLLIGLYMRKSIKKEYLEMTVAFYNNIFKFSKKTKIKKTLPVRHLMIDNETEIKLLLNKVCWDCYYIFQISGEGCTENIITENMLIKYVSEKGFYGKARDIAL